MKPRAVAGFAFHPHLTFITVNNFPRCTQTDSETTKSARLSTFLVGFENFVQTRSFNPMSAVLNDNVCHLVGVFSRVTVILPPG